MSNPAAAAASTTAALRRTGRYRRTVGVLAVIVAAGLLGPVLGMSKRFPVPVVIGEIAAGMLIGPLVLDIVHPGEPLVEVMHDAGFALLMFTVGLHLRLHDPSMRRAAPRASIALAVTALFAVPIGLLISSVSDLGHPAAVAVVLATSSAALAMPVLTDAAGGELPDSFAGLAAWIVLADVLTIVALPLVASVGSVWRVMIASLAVTVIAWLLVNLMRVGRVSALWQRLSTASREKGWGIEMRLALVILFALAWIGPKLGTSMLVAGFAAGLAVSAFGVSTRLTTQLVGIGEGFLIPAFFVILGTTLQPQGLAGFDGLVLFGGLVVGTLVVHLAGAFAAGFRPAFAFVASAQLGVPLALVTIGQAQGWLTGEEAASFVAAALVSIGFTAWGAQRLGRRRHHGLRSGVPSDLRLDDITGDGTGGSDGQSGNPIP